MISKVYYFPLILNTDEEKGQTDGKIKIMNGMWTRSERVRI
jgi:hypothetical protein